MRSLVAAILVIGAIVHPLRALVVALWFAGLVLAFDVNRRTGSALLGAVTLPGYWGALSVAIFRVSRWWGSHPEFSARVARAAGWTLEGVGAFLIAGGAFYALAYAILQWLGYPSITLALGIAVAGFGFLAWKMRRAAAARQRGAPSPST